MIEHLPGGSAEADELRLELAGAREEILMYRALGKCLAQFSISFAESQKSMAEMAAGMQAERQTAQRASKVAGETKGTVQEIADCLQQMADESAETVKEVGALHRQTRRTSCSMVAPWRTPDPPPPVTVGLPSASPEEPSPQTERAHSA